MIHFRNRLFRPIAIVSVITVAGLVSMWFSIDHDYVGTPGPDGVIPLHMVRYINDVKIVFESIGRDPANQTIRLRGKIYYKTPPLFGLEVSVSAVGQVLTIDQFGLQVDDQAPSEKGVLAFKTGSSSAPTNTSELEWAIYYWPLRVIHFETPNPPYLVPKIPWPGSVKIQEGNGLRMTLDSCRLNTFLPGSLPRTLYQRFWDLFSFVPTTHLMPHGNASIQFTLTQLASTLPDEFWNVTDLQVQDAYGGLVCTAQRNETSTDYDPQPTLETNNPLNPTSGPFRIIVTVTHEKLFPLNELEKLQLPKPGESVSINKTYSFGTEQLTLLGLFGKGVHLKKPEIQIDSPTAVFIGSDGVKRIDFRIENEAIIFYSGSNAYKSYSFSKIAAQRIGKQNTMLFPLNDSFIFTPLSIKVSFLMLTDQQTFIFYVEPSFIK